MTGERLPAEGGLPAPIVTGYPLDNASRHGGTHLAGISRMYDEFTLGQIMSQLGQRSLAGAICLEVGAGNGSIALQLARRVGPSGIVIALDLDPQHIPTHDRLARIRRDLTKDRLPPGPFDLIHGRLILGHLPNRDTLLPHLCGLLAPGGVIAFEEFHLPPDQPHDRVLAEPPDLPGIGALWREFAHLRMEIFAERGTDPAFADRMYGLMVGASLVATQTIPYTRPWRGGEPGSWHALGTLEQFRPQLAERGFGPDKVNALVQALDHPGFEVSGRTLISTSGRRPG